MAARAKTGWHAAKPETAKYCPLKTPSIPPLFPYFTTTACPCSPKTSAVQINNKKTYSSIGLNSLETLFVLPKS